jgi:hypothetical protein
MEIIHKATEIFRSLGDTIFKSDRFQNLKETEMILCVTVNLRISARRYGRALETPRCLAANGLLAL